MKHITLLLAVVALSATFTPHTSNASPSAPPKAEPRPPVQSLDMPHSAFVTDQTPDLNQAALRFEILTACSDEAAPVAFAILRPDDAPQAPQPQLVAILTRREAAQLRRADWLHMQRVADPTAA